ncbi:BBT_HP_G0009920.mRNA.1.CDS.1 [Saccharomyces cerevisiae]|nr:BBT_HP_G0053280.mRNA.1.CDS.1 [Saccharomyces cerevisiae]CAI5206063.1 BBT_HP_G0009920.mRNA.1.CDS.1 [Saccharomyces cerevisiae]CAI6691386.1 BBT_HP_G0053280.mRNA.1.CDS.1 [Saccharomyces cerevisiae]CAI7010697.1 BBT_HP_G0009920.mRNA.1.CDS.1 [Saccharomyces cerevisiae]
MQQNSEFLTETPGSDPHISQLHANSVMESQLLDDFLLNGSPMYQDDSMAHINIDEGANFQNFIKTDEGDSPNLLSFEGIGNNTHVSQNVSTPLEEEMESNRALKEEEEDEHENKVFNEENIGNPAHDEIVFGRKETIQSVYINPLDYLKVNAAQLPLDVEVSGLPQVSRVENQLKLKVKITSETPLNQSMLYLPSDSISREKFYLKKNIEDFSEDFKKNLLYINAFVLCAVSNRTTNVCTKCVKREQRRAARRKSGIADNLLWCNNINRRLVVFNNKQVFPIMKTFDNVKEFELTTRLVCYCRHHKANNGFVILFTITDWQNRLLGKFTTTPIMITDRKPANMDTTKFNNTTTSSRRQLTEEESTTEYYSTDNNQLSKDENMPFQYTYQHNPYDNDSQMNNIPLKDKNVPFPYSISQQTDLLQNNNLSLNLSLPNQHIPSPTSMSEEGSESFNYHHRDNDNPVRTISLTNIEQQSQLNQRKRARNNLENDIGKPLFKHSFSNSISATNTMNPALHSMQDFSMKNNNNNLPSINRVIPSQGPINGGIEVTLLGCNFKDGLSVKFGSNLALSTQCWSETTIVTYLPPAAYAGQVFVSITDTNNENNNDDLPQEIEINDNKKAIFTYVDDTDRQLIELALQIVGLKMNGKLEDARNIAKRIVGNDSPDSGTNGNSCSKSTGPSPNQHSMNLNTSVLYSDEVLIQKVIKSLNINSNISICDSLGRTLLHLVCLKNYSSLVYTLIKKGARVNDIDSFGLTPLHFACISGDPKIIKMLLNCKVNYSLRSHNGLTAREVFIANHIHSEEVDKKQENRDNHKFVHNDTYISEVLSLFEEFQNGTKFTDSVETDSNYSISRKYSQSSFNSSLLDNESLNENLFESQSMINPTSMEIQHPTLQLFENSSYSEYDQSDFEEDGDEDLFVTDEVEKPGVACREEQSELLDIGSSANEPEEDNGSTSLWNRVLHRINDDLPKYEDLFPLSWGKDDKLKTTNQDSIVEQSASNIENSENSEEEDYEEEEEFLKKQFNRFFQNKQNFRNDKMLIFFWIPLTLLLLTWFIMYKFGNQDSSINHISELISEYLRIALAKFLLGNERMKTAFRSKLSNLQTTRMLNDLIVS